MAYSPGMRTRFQDSASECSICSCAISEQGVLDTCTHLFCLACILKWAGIENSCPICKQRFSRVTRKWLRKCLRESHSPSPTIYPIPPKNQEPRAHTAVDFAGGEFRLRVVIPWAGGQALMRVGGGVV